MKLSRYGSRRYSGHTKIFEAKPAISWNTKSKELNLKVNGVRGLSGDPSFYNYRISLTVTELQTMVGALVSDESR